jgi:hypothetical protein
VERDAWIPPELKVARNCASAFKGKSPTSASGLQLVFDCFISQLCGIFRSTGQSRQNSAEILVIARAAARRSPARAHSIEEQALQQRKPAPKLGDEPGLAANGALDAVGAA